MAKIGRHPAGAMASGTSIRARVPPPLRAVRPEPSDDPAIQLVEAFPDVGAAVVVAPSSDHRVDGLNQVAQSQRHLPFRQGSDLILETVQRLLRGNGVQIL